jgi:hypothetical protein
MVKAKSFIDPAEADALADSLRKKLRRKLKRLPDKVIFEFGTKPKKPGIATGTDWPDSFNRDRWYNTWAKSGADMVTKTGPKTGIKTGIKTGTKAGPVTAKTSASKTKA